MAETTLRLVGDIGGTNARLGVARTGDGRRGAGLTAIEQIAHLATAEYATAEAALVQYVASLPADRKPAEAVLAVAGPVVHGVADLTNAKGWHLDERSLAAALGLARVRVSNDFAALARAVAEFDAADLHPVGGCGLIDATQTVSLIGPGTGTGVGARIVDGATAAILVCEGGHIAFAPGDSVELELLRVLARRFGRVSVERILAGQGLVNLHQALAEIEGRDLAETTPGAITDAALQGDALALATLNRFFAILGGVAGDLALVHGALGGVVLAGGILPRVRNLLDQSSFRSRFEDKGRMSILLRQIPTNLLIATDVALSGAAGLRL